MAEAITKESTSRYRWVILGICWLAYIVVFMHRLSVGPLGPFLKEDLQLSSTQVASLMSAAAFGYMCTVPIAGWLADRIGVRWMLGTGSLIGGIFITLMFFAHSFTLGLVIMAVAGLGCGCLMPSTTKAILVWFPLKERASAMGFKQTAVNVGGIIAAATLPAIALTLGWRYGFLIIGCVAIVIGVICFTLYKDPTEEVSPSASESHGSTASGAVRKALKGRDIWLLTAAGTFVAITEFAVIAHLVLYLTEALLFAAVAAGGFLAMTEAGGAFGKPISGLLSDRVFGGSRKKPYILMCGIAALTCIIISFLPSTSPAWMLPIICIIFGFAGIGWGGLHLTLVGEFAGKEAAATVVGITSVFTMIGVMVGPLVFGYLVDTTGSYRLPWLFIAICAAVALLLLLFIREGTRRI